MYQKKPVPPADTIALVLSGVDDVTVEQDSEFEPLVGVSATDDVDGDSDRCRQGVRFRWTQRKPGGGVLDVKTRDRQHGHR
ncbi:MAG: hypothetical protein ACLVEF_06630 [Bifidobacterium bifidum]